jgi:hypothetical protein
MKYWTVLGMLALIASLSLLLPAQFATGGFNPVLLNRPR